MNIWFDRLDGMNTTIWKHGLFEKLGIAKQIIVFGAGRSGAFFLNALQSRGILASCICDNSKMKQGKKLYGLRVYSFQEAIKKYPEAIICIASLYYDEIKKQILNSDSCLIDRIEYVTTQMVWETFKETEKNEEVTYIKEHICEFEVVYELLQDQISKQCLEGILNYRITREICFLEQIKSNGNTYFDEDFFEKGTKQFRVFLDGGSYTGDTVLAFINFVGSYSKIICFDASGAVIKQLKDTINKYEIDGVEIYQAALWNQCEVLNFLECGSGGSSISNSKHNTVVNGLAVDELHLGGLDFIKLDIEGAEKEALMGAEKTIRDFFPVLAISAYHKQEDLLLLPKLIKQMNPNYYLYLRHYMSTPGETVLYAVRKENHSVDFTTNP